MSSYLPGTDPSIMTTAGPPSGFNFPSFLQQLFRNRGTTQPSEQPRVDFGGGLATEPRRSDDGSGGTIAEIGDPRRGFGGYSPPGGTGGVTSTSSIPGYNPSYTDGGRGGRNALTYASIYGFGQPRQPRGFGGFGGYGGMGMNPMMGMGLGGGFGMGYPQMGGFGYGFGQGMGGFPRGGYGGFGGFGNRFGGYGGMGGFGMSPYQNQFQNQGMMNQGLGAYNRGMMENQRMIGTLQPQQQQQVAQPQVQPQQQPMQAQQQAQQVTATPYQQQFQQAFY